MKHIITISFFEGSQYWEVLVDGRQVFTSPYRYEAYMFAAELEVRIS